MNKKNWTEVGIGLGLLVGASFLWSFSWTFLVLVFLAGGVLSSPLRALQDKLGQVDSGSNKKGVKWNSE